MSITEVDRWRGERDHVEEQLDEVDRQLDTSDDVELFTKRAELADRFVELTDLLAGQPDAPVASPRGTPSSIEELKQQYAERKDHIVDMRVTAEELAEVAKAFPDGSARKAKAEREAAQARQAFIDEMHATDEWRGANDIRLATQKLIDHSSQREAARRWVAFYSDKVGEYREREARRKREGLKVWSYEKEIQMATALMHQPPTAEFIAGVREEMVRDKAEQIAAKAVTTTSPAPKDRTPKDGGFRYGRRMEGHVPIDAASRW